MCRFYVFGSGLIRSAFKPPYQVPTNEPESLQSLRIFALDPSVSRYGGAVCTVEIPIEDKIERGPCTGLFTVSDNFENIYQKGQLDIEDKDILRLSGLQPDQADSNFHSQMAYSVSLYTYETFRKALGRHLSWGFHEEKSHTPLPLKIKTRAIKKANAVYDRGSQSVSFGYTENENSLQSGQLVFTGLSSDIIAHEVSHALLDGLKPYLIEQTNPQVAAFHEAFADLVALFQHFTFKELVKTQLSKANGDISAPGLLRMLAPQVGNAIRGSLALRSFQPALNAIETGNVWDDKIIPKSLSCLEKEGVVGPHAAGRVLAEALFDAFHTILNRKLDPLVKLATNGSGVLPEGELPEALLTHVVHVTSRTARQFLNICIRAIDYCPPVDINFGDYVRAVITADRELVGSDPYGYREAIVMACMLRGVFPEDIQTPSESTLVWKGAASKLRPITELQLSNLNFVGDPAVPLDRGEVERQARIFGVSLKKSKIMMNELGLRTPSREYSPIEITSVRSSRRVGPDDQVAFDLILEVVQTRTLVVNGHSVNFRGGSTVILGPTGRIRYVIKKRVDSRSRENAYLNYFSDPDNLKSLAQPDSRFTK